MISLKNHKTENFSLVPGIRQLNGDLVKCSYLSTGILDPDDLPLALSSLGFKKCLQLPQLSLQVRHLGEGRGNSSRLYTHPRLLPPACLPQVSSLFGQLWPWPPAAWSPRAAGEVGEVEARCHFSPHFSSTSPFWPLELTGDHLI